MKKIRFWSIISLQSRRSITSLQSGWWNWMYIRYSMCFYWVLCYSKNIISIIQFRGYQYYWRGPDTKTRPHVCRQPCPLCEHPNEQATVAGGDGHTVEAENISILHVNVPCHTRLKCTPPLSAVTLWEWEERKKCFILGFHRLSSLWCMFNRRGLGWWSSFFSHINLALTVFILHTTILYQVGLDSGICSEFDWICAYFCEWAGGGV